MKRFLDWFFSRQPRVSRVAINDVLNSMNVDKLARREWKGF